MPGLRGCCWEFFCSRGQNCYCSRSLWCNASRLFLACSRCGHDANCSDGSEWSQGCSASCVDSLYRTIVIIDQYLCQWLFRTHSCVQSLWLAMGACWPTASEIGLCWVYGWVSSIVEWYCLKILILVLLDVRAWSDLIVLEKLGAWFAHFVLDKNE